MLFQGPVGQRTIHVANKTLQTPDPGDGVEPGGCQQKQYCSKGGLKEVRSAGVPEP